MATDVMSNLQTFFGEAPTKGKDLPNSLNRYMGGHRRNNQPFISGYWYLILTPPEQLFSSASTPIATNWFHSAAESFTPPSRSILKVDVPGMGGLSSSFIAGQEIGRTFSVAFREYQNLPISTAIDLWTSIIDKHLGISPVGGKEFIPSSYKGDCLAILTKPTVGAAGGEHNASELIADDIEQIYYMPGVFPENTAHDTFAADISGNDTLQLSINFSFDGGFYTRENATVMTKALEMINALGSPEIGVHTGSDVIGDDMGVTTIVTPTA